MITNEGLKGLGSAFLQNYNCENAGSDSFSFLSRFTVEDVGYTLGTGFRVEDVELRSRYRVQGSRGQVEKLQKATEGKARHPPITNFK